MSHAHHAPEMPDAIDFDEVERVDVNDRYTLIVLGAEINGEPCRALVIRDWQAENYICQGYVWSTGDGIRIEAEGFDLGVEDVAEAVKFQTDRLLRLTEEY